MMIKTRKFDQLNRLINQYFSRGNIYQFKYLSYLLNYKISIYLLERMGSQICGVSQRITIEDQSYPKEIANKIQILQKKNQNLIKNAHKIDYPNGSKYWGNHDSENLRTGFGHYIKGTMQYIGQYNKNLFHGQGILLKKIMIKSHSATLIEQQSQNNKKPYRSQGFIPNQNQDQNFRWEYYEGQFKNGKCHGQGIQVRQKFIFVGDFVEGQRRFGIFQTKDFKYEGNFRNNMFHGQGKINFNSGASYQGQFQQGKISGDGKYFGKQNVGNTNKSSRDSYQGRFKAGKFNGYGVYQWAKGEKYEGQYEEGLKHGYGKIKTASAEYAGKWYYGRKQGKGIVSQPDNFENLKP